jgi:hypothetical protein
MPKSDIYLAISGDDHARKHRLYVNYSSTRFRNPQRCRLCDDRTGRNGQSKAKLRCLLDTAETGGLTLKYHQILVNSAVVEEGFDVPEADLLVERIRPSLNCVTSSV